LPASLQANKKPHPGPSSTDGRLRKIAAANAKHDKTPHNLLILNKKRQVFRSRLLHGEVFYQRQGGNGTQRAKNVRDWLARRDPAPAGTDVGRSNDRFRDTMTGENGPISSRQAAPENNFSPPTWLGNGAGSKSPS